MLRINRNQFDKLKALKAQEFCQQVCTYLSEHYPKEFDILGSRDDQHDWTREVIEKAHGIGVDKETDIYCIARIAIATDENFFELPWAEQIIAMDVKPSTKALLLENSFSKQLHEERESIARERKRILELKKREFIEEKSQYVLSFNAFYGLGINSLGQAEEWLYEVVDDSFSIGFDVAPLLDSYLELAMYYGKNFIEQDWVQEVVHSELSAGEKCSALLKQLSNNLDNGTES